MLKDKVVMITGASSGIGRACAEVFAEQSCRLVLLARRRQALDELAAELKARCSFDYVNLQCDVRDYAMVENAYNSLPEDWKNVDVLINNAGLARGMDKIQDAVVEDWNEMIDTNIKGLLYVSKMVIPSMAARGKGIIINIGSIAGNEVYPGGSVYCATKHAVKAISKGMAMDLNGTGVRVANLEPGLVETEFSDVRFHGDRDKAAAVYKGYTPLTGRDIAEAALFIATRPSHVMVQNMLITPTDQASALILNRK